MGGDVSGRLSLLSDHQRRIETLEKREREDEQNLAQLKLELTATLGKLQASVEACEKPLKLMSKIVLAFFLTFATLSAGALFQMFRARVADPPPPARSGERLGSDRVPDPPSDLGGQHHP